MKIPVKRKNCCEGELCRKRIRVQIGCRLVNSKSPFAKLRKDLFIQIFDYLESSEFRCVIPMVCSFFYNIVRENRQSHWAICVSNRVTDEFSGIFAAQVIPGLSKFQGFSKIKITQQSKYDTRKLDLLENCLIRRVLISDSIKCPILHLELFFVNFNCFAYKTLFKNLGFLKVLKIETQSCKKAEVLFLTKTIFGFGQVGKTLKKLYLNLGNIQGFDGQHPEYKVNTLELENFSIKLKNNISWPRFSLLLGSNLQVLKVPHIEFNTQSAVAFCQQIGNQYTLKTLQVSDSVFKAGEIFFYIIQKQLSLEVLKLEPTSENYTIKTEEILTLLQKINKNTLKSLKVHSSELQTYINIIEPASQPEFGLIDQDLSSKFMNTLVQFLKASPNLQKLDLETKFFPNKFLVQISEKIQENLNHLNFYSFGKYNIKHLQNEKCSTVEIKIPTYSKSINILIHVLYGIIMKNKSICNVKGKEYSSPLKNGKSKLEPFIIQSGLTLKVEKASSPVSSFITLCLIPRNFPLIEHLDLSTICISPFILLFSRLLSPLSSLKSLKFSIKSLPKLFEYTIYEIFTSASRLKSLQSLYCSIQATISRMNKIFYTFSRHKTLEIFHLAKSKILTVQSISQELSLKEAFVVSTIKELALEKCALTFTKFSQICEVLTSSAKLEKIKLDDIVFELDPWESYLENEENKWKHILKHFFMFINSVKTKTQYLTIALRLAELPPSRFPIFPQIIDEYLRLCTELLYNNKQIQNFSIIFPVSQEHLPKYSHFFLSYLKSNQNLSILNYYNIKKIISEEVPTIKTKKFFVQMNKNLFSSIKKPTIELTEPDEVYAKTGTVPSLMPLILSELVKNKNNFFISTINRTVSKIELMNQILTIMKIGGEFTLFETTEKTLILNCLSSCMTVKKLIIADIYLYRLDIQVIMNNLPKMVNLKILKVKNVKFRVIDYAVFLLPPKLKSFSLVCLDIQRVELQNWTACAGKRNIVKFSVKSNAGFASNEKFSEFLQRIKHESIEVLKLKFSLMAQNLQVLAMVLKNSEFPALKKLKVGGKVFEGFSNCEELAKEVCLLSSFC